MSVLSALRLLMVLVGLVALSGMAHADCTSPAAVAGSIIYSSTYNQPAWCNGTSWQSFAGSGGGGNASTAGSTNDVQFNSGGTLAADTGNFTYSGGVFTAPTVSSTYHYGQYASFTTIYNPGSFSGNSIAANSVSSSLVSASAVSATLIQAGASSATCASSINGAIRYNNTSNTLQICTGSTWTSLSSNTTGGGTMTGAGSATAIAFWNGASSLTYESATTSGLYWDSTNKRLGIGTNTPNWGLTVSGSMIVNTSSATDSAVYMTAAGIAGNTGTPIMQAANAANVVVKNLALEPYGGNVGIGTTSPTAILQVSGSLIVSRTGQTSTPTFMADVNGVAIGKLTAANNFVLDVSGNTNVAGTISASSAIQVGSSSLTCSSGISGSLRYSIASSTVEYCNSTAWTSLGPSSTQPVAFYAHNNGVNETITASSDTKLTFSTEAFDTNNNYSTSTSRFTATIPGKYLILIGIRCTNTTASCSPKIYKNGAAYFSGVDASSNGSHGQQIMGIVDMNGSTDYVEAYAYATGTGISGAKTDLFFQGVMLAPQGGGGTANPAGSTADVQFNSSGALAADTGNFTYASGLLKAPTVSATALNSQYLSATTIYNPGSFSGNSISANSVSSSVVSSTAISGTLIQVGSSGSSCVAGLNGSIRYNSTSNTLQICVGSIWTSLSSDTTTGTGTVTGAGSATAIAFWNGTSSLTYDSATTSGLYWDNTKKVIGIGTNAPLQTLGRGIYISNSQNTGTTDSNAGVYLESLTRNAHFQTSIPVSATSNFLAYTNGFGNILGGMVIAGNNGAPTTRFYTSDTERVRITSTGFVGISNTNPQAPLDVGGEISISNTSLACSANTTGGALRYVSGTGMQYCSGSNAWTTLGSGAGPTGTGSATAVALWSGSGALTYENSTTTALYWDRTNGRLGIGTNTPTQDLDVRGTGVVLASGTLAGFVTRDRSAGTGSAAFYRDGNKTYIWDTYAGGTNRVTIDTTNGYVGIGKTSPAAMLDVNGEISISNTSLACAANTTGGAIRYVSGTGIQYCSGSNAWTSLSSNTTAVTGTGSSGYVSYWTSANNQSYDNAANGQFFWDGSNHRLGLGNISPGYTLDISSSTGIRSYSTPSGVFMGVVMGYNQISSWNTPLFINYSSTSNTLINGAGGSVGIGTSTPGYTLDVSGSERVTGNVTAAAFLYSSDKRLKSDITNLTGGLVKLDALNPVSFRFTSDASKTIHLGLIAQDVQKVYPEAVKADDKGFLKLDYPALVGSIIDMLKELKVVVFSNHADITKLQAANDNLLQEVRELHAANDNLEAANRLLKSANVSTVERLDGMERTLRAHGW